MKKLILSLAVAGFFTASTSAQQNRLTEETILQELKSRTSAKDKASYLVEKVNELCSLTAEQTKQLLEFTEAHFAKRIAVGLEESKDVVSMFDEGFKNEMKRLLTETQLETIRSYGKRKSAEEHHHHDHGHDHNHNH